MSLMLLVPKINHAKAQISRLESNHQEFFKNINRHPTPAGDIPTKLTASGNEISAIIFDIEVSASKRFVRSTVIAGEDKYFLEYTFHANHQDSKAKVWQFYLDENADILESTGSNKPLCDCVDGLITTNTICCFLINALLNSPVFAPT